MRKIDFSIFLWYNIYIKKNRKVRVDGKLNSKRLPAFGKIQYFIASKGGLLLAIMIPAVFVLFYDSFKILKEIKHFKERKEIEELENI